MRYSPHSSDSKIPAVRCFPTPRPAAPSCSFQIGGPPSLLGLRLGRHNQPTTHFDQWQPALRQLRNRPERTRRSPIELLPELGLIGQIFDTAVHDSHSLFEFYCFDHRPRDLATPFAGIGQDPFGSRQLERQQHPWYPSPGTKIHEATEWLGSPIRHDKTSSVVPQVSHRIATNDPSFSGRAPDPVQTNVQVLNRHLVTDG